jgi:ribosomal protein L11 methyltransferase
MEHEAIIEAGAGAFGDGRHPTTAGVLAALEAIDPQAFAPTGAADIGAGSGILSFAIATRFGCPVVATELDRQAAEILQENVRINARAANITVLQADGFNHPQLHARAPFDLIVMNILAAPLLKLAADAERALAREGVLILSGMLAWQEPQIRDAYQSLGLELAARLTLQDWVTLSLVKP